MSEKVDETTETPEPTLELQIQELQESNAHLKESLEYQKNENKKAYDKRQKLSDEVKTLKATDSSKDDLVKYIEDLEGKVSSRDAQLLEISTREEFGKKIGALKDTASKLGLKDTYLERLDKFVDMSEIDHEKPVSMRIAVDTMKTNYPDLFSTNGHSVDAALPSPKLGTGNGDYEKQYRDLLAVNPPDRKADHYQRLATLKELLQ